MTLDSSHISDRFLGRASVYAQARPGYPAELASWLAGHIRSSTPIVDVGAGTGIFTQFLLPLSDRVVALEPNAEMRAELAGRLADAMRAGQVTVIDGTAERTGLPDGSVELVAAAQAAHWFEPAATVAELRRVLTASGRVLFVWNDWRPSQTPFNRGYAEIVRTFLRPGNENVETRVPADRIPELLPGGYIQHQFRNPVQLSRERLRALAMSASYLPGPEDRSAPQLRAALDRLFEQHSAGRSWVTIEYQTSAYLGSVNQPPR